ncbi:CRE-ARX-3 protein [Pelomyxa schiedti]|nr:CRE-ARX-3 protein [Pelomyxa schiedti]
MGDCVRCPSVHQSCTYGTTATTHCCVFCLLPQTVFVHIIGKLDESSALCMVALAHKPITAAVVAATNLGLIHVTAIGWKRSVVYNFGVGLTCHSWHPHLTHLAVCPSSNKVEVWKVTKAESGFSVHKSATLHIEDGCDDHIQPITCVDWGLGQEPANITRRGIKNLKCNPSNPEHAYACGSAICLTWYYDECNRWTSRRLKVHAHAVTCLAWHPNKILLASGSIDGAVKVSMFATMATRKTVKNTHCEFSSDTGAWVHAVCWSPQGKLACSSHSSTISIIDYHRPGKPKTQISFPMLPMTGIGFVSENLLIACGHDSVPFIFGCSESGGTWRLISGISTTGVLFSVDHRYYYREVEPTTSSSQFFPNRSCFSTADSKGCVALWEPL